MAQLLGGFDRSPKPDFPYPKDIQLSTMTQYNVRFGYPIAFPPQKMNDVLSEWLSKQGVKQCHIAETEKYAHVTFFFNGGVEKQFENEERDMIPSPKVATYDLQPEMSAPELTEVAVGAIQSGQYQLIVVNYANGDIVADKTCERIKEGKFEFIMLNFAPPDMVGHTGVYEAAIEGVTETDKSIKKIYEQCKESGYILFVTADHG